MAVDGVLAGQRVGPVPVKLDADFLAGYAAATGSTSGVPLTALATVAWEAATAALSGLVPADLQAAATGGVHGEHDIVLHRPVLPGEPLTIWAEGHGARPAGRNSLVAIRYLAYDEGGELVAEQWWTTVFLGVTCAASGLPVPDHAFPSGARERVIGTWAVDVDADMARRYAEVSGDWSAHHFEAAAARRSGFDRVFLHGLATLGLCARGVAEVAAGGDVSRVRRIAVRFATPVFLGEQLSVHVCDAGPLGLAFEADCGGAPVIAHGRAELR